MYHNADQSEPKEMITVVVDKQLKGIMALVLQWRSSGGELHVKRSDVTCKPHVGSGGSRSPE